MRILSTDIFLSSMLFFSSRSCMTKINLSIHLDASLLYLSAEYSPMSSYLNPDSFTKEGIGERRAKLSGAFFFPMYAHENMCANLTRAYSHTGMGVISNEKGSNEKKNDGVTFR